MKRNKAHTHHNRPVRDVSKAIIASAENNPKLRANAMNRALIAAAVR